MQIYKQPYPVGPTEILASQEQLDSRILNPGWDDVAQAYGLELEGTPKARFEQLSNLSDASWDMRKGTERHHVNWDEGDLADPDSNIGKQIFEGATKLGLVESSTAPDGDYDWMLILGGGMRSILQRLQYGLEQDNLSFENIAVLASTRKISDKEKEAVASFAPQAETEADVARASVEHLMAVRGRQFTLNRIGYDYQSDELGTVDRYNTDNGNIYVLCAPCPDIEGRNRADTTDTYRLFRTFAKNHLGPDTSVVVSTNAIYTGFQGVDAEKELTDITGAQVTMIGFDAAYGGIVRRPNQLVTEMRSYLNSIKRRQQAIDQRLQDEPQAQVTQPNQSVVARGGNFNLSPAEIAAKARHESGMPVSEVADENLRRAQMLGGISMPSQKPVVSSHKTAISTEHLSWSDE